MTARAGPLGPSPTNSKLSREEAARNNGFHNGGNHDDQLPGPRALSASRPAWRGQLAAGPAFFFPTST